MTFQRHRAYRAALLLACGLYLAACALPATIQWRVTSFSGNGSFGYKTEYGWVCLICGWLNVLGAVETGSPGMLAWLANPLALVSAVLLLFRRPTGAATFGAASVLVGGMYLIVPPINDGHPDSPQVGAWLWFGSFIALTVASLIRRKHSQAQSHVVNL
jgi:drug/metabolite transporter (DMT)-like permease